MGAGGDPFGEGPQCLIPLHASAALARHMAAADVDVHRLPPVEALLDEPVRLGWSGLRASPLLLLPPFFVRDPPPGALEVRFLDAFEEEELIETGDVRVVHMFDITTVESPRSHRGPTRGAAVDATALLRTLGVDPAVLDPAPTRPRGRDGFDRVGLTPVPCSLCGEPAYVTKVVALPGGQRWLDRCRTCFLATVHLDPGGAPSMMEGILADLRAAAAEAGVDLTVVTDDAVAG